jgi:AAA15 family ATPase/GTPase
MEPWHLVYTLLAELLADFYTFHNQESGAVLYSKLSKKIEFRKSFLNRLSTVKSVDPIHIFVSFNRSKQGVEERIAIINSLLEVLDSDRRFYNIDFFGCPAPFSIRISSTRPFKIQLEIWDTFRQIMAKEQSALNSALFKRLDYWFGVNIVSFSIFLFWIKPRCFLSLDRNTMTLLFEAGIVDHQPKNYREYMRLLIGENIGLYIQVASQAISLPKDHSARQNALAELQRAFLHGNQRDIGSLIFRLVAITPCRGTAKKYRRNLAPDHIYPFYRLYEFRNDGTVEYYPEKEFGLYNLQNLDISVSAIAGKNGSGKSTLMELLFLAINNLSHLYLGKSAQKDLSFQDYVKIDLYYHQVGFYKISLRGRTAKIYSYSFENNRFTVSQEQPMQWEDFSRFFYTVAVSYSQYSLNSIKIGYWIQNLFHKNDGYQIPLVISPMRDEGNFDINKEDKLLRSRLLAIILQPVDDKDGPGLRQITEKGYVKHVEIRRNEDKITKLTEVPIRKNQRLIKTVLDFFGVQNKDLTGPYAILAQKYIIQKLFKIGDTYEKYKIYVNKKSKEVRLDKLDAYLIDLKKDNSHITHKLKQAIYFLKYKTYAAEDLNHKISIDRLSRRLVNIMSDALEEGERTLLIQLIPPSFFEAKIYLDKGFELDDLSSGELQKIYSASSIAYHLSNLESVPDSERQIRYPYVNILFDEVELYFHPDMQRTFIDYLIDYLSRIGLDRLYAVNFCFITHSPFILSDIPSENILLLEDGKIKSQNELGFETFGGNIHDLLRHQFFLDQGSMGQFAQAQIDYAIKFLNPQIQTATTVDPTRLKEEWTREKVRKLINIIGDELVRSALNQLYYSGEEATETEIDRQIKTLQEIKERRKNNSQK